MDLAQSLLLGDKPAVDIQGDVQLAAEVAWLVDNVRWDVEEDLSRVVGDATAHTLARVARKLLRTAIKGFAAVVRQARCQRFQRPIAHRYRRTRRMSRLFRGVFIVWVVLRHGLDELVLSGFEQPWIKALRRMVSLGRNLDAPRGQRLA